MAAKIESFRHSFSERSKERLLSRKGYSDFGLNSSECGDERVKCGWFGKMSDGLVEFCNSVQEVSVKLYQMGRSDPRKAYFAAKMGLSLAIVSLLIFFKEPLKDASQYSILAILTVVVVFKFSIGATLNKGFNRALGKISAGGLALGIAELAVMAGTGRRFTVGLVMLLRGVDANEHCSWCHYLSCVPTSKWSCNSEPAYCSVEVHTNSVLIHGEVDPNSVLIHGEEFAACGLWSFYPTGFS